MKVCKRKWHSGGCNHMISSQSLRRLACHNILDHINIIFQFIKWYDHYLKRLEGGLIFVSSLLPREIRQAGLKCFSHKEITKSLMFSQSEIDVSTLCKIHFEPGTYFPGRWGPQIRPLSSWWSTERQEKRCPYCRCRIINYWPKDGSWRKYK